METNHTFLSLSVVQKDGRRLTPQTAIGQIVPRNNTAWTHLVPSVLCRRVTQSSLNTSIPSILSSIDATASPIPRPVSRHVRWGWGVDSEENDEE